MENKDQPAFAAMSSSANGTRHKQEGLTKRELIATMMAQGLASNSVPGSHHLTKNLITEALELTDELLSQLQSKPQSI